MPPVADILKFTFRKKTVDMYTRHIFRDGALVLKFGARDGTLLLEMLRQYTDNINFRYRV